MVCAGRTRLYAGKLPVEEVRRRLNDYYWPYHNELGRLLKGFRDSHGIAPHMSCHSMPAVAGPGTPDAGTRRSSTSGTATAQPPGRRSWILSPRCCGASVTM